eukprot:TRINITY_DN24588_c0_g7_i2.p1 TRINITY_DN24588_c0_g7~~TRINITY_DN24588_c0_g7_i2.p1  ORF type:complete len:649 (-),score=189.78 TRINITY_DN24588_c0_g7_i2:83-2029(-)
MPTRKNTMMPTRLADEEDDEIEEEVAQSKSPIADVAVNSTPKANPAAQTALQSALPLPPPSQQNRRRSALGVFSNDGVKAAGLYALPKEEDHNGKTGELVEVKRGSIVMSSNMLSEILKSKVSDERLQDIEEAVGEEAGEDVCQVVLPFFTAAKGAIRQCHCSKDPATGLVIHTCMTPAATQCDNTQAFTSFVCSAWGSRWGSRRNSGKNSKSRRGSVDEDDSDEDEFRALPPKQLQTGGPSSSKRIRNASMLAIVNSAGPAPQKQDTDAPAKASGSEAGDSSDEEAPEENELSVSFKHINNQAAESDTPEFVLSPERQSIANSSAVASPNGPPGGLDHQVENDLGHRFDLVEPWQLAAMLKNREAREQTLAVDVRGRDWVGGHIPLSINLHTSEVLRQPESLVMQCLRNRINHLIFTCMYSVVRARKSALAVEQAQNEAQKAGLQTYRIRISLLAGGMHAWVNHFIRIHPQKSLVQDFDPECWSDGGPAQGGLVHVMDALWSSGGQKALSDALTAELSSLMLTRGGADSIDGSRRASSTSEKGQDGGAQANDLLDKEPSKPASGGGRRGSRDTNASTSASASGGGSNSAEGSSGSSVATSGGSGGVAAAAGAESQGAAGEGRAEDAEPEQKRQKVAQEEADEEEEDN